MAPVDPIAPAPAESAADDFADIPAELPAGPAADASRSGEGTDAQVLFTEVYQRLKAMASRQLAARPPGGTLQTTALVHELYLRVCSARELHFEHPVQFFAYAARAMRHLLCDRARHRLRQRAGGGWVAFTLDGEDGRLAVESAEQALLLERALAELEQADARAARVVELRYFAGLSLEQVAEALGLARRTIDRDWRFARAFLHQHLD